VGGDDELEKLIHGGRFLVRLKNEWAHRPQATLPH
jgi:hypothetical protein